MELLQRFLYSALGAAAIFYVIVKVRLSYWKQRGILHEKPKFLWGNLKGVGGKHHISTALKAHYNKYKGQAPFIGFYAYLKPMVMVLDLELVQQILQDSADHFSERGLYNDVRKQPLTGNLMQLDGLKWRTLHKDLQPLFNAPEKLEFLLSSMLKVAETFGSSVASNQRVGDVFIINELARCYNLDMISSLAFGLETNTLNNAYPKAFGVMSNEFMPKLSRWRAFLAFSFPVIARALKIGSYNEAACAYYQKLVKDKLLEREWTHGQQLHDFLQLLLELKQDTQALNRQQIAAQSFSFLVAGLEAANSTLTYCLFELAMQPQLQQKARQEIKTVLQAHNQQLTVASLQSMQYLKQVLYETLRKYTPYPFLLRNTVQDYEFKDNIFMLCKGNAVLIPTAAIHMDPHIYPNPLKFDPQRFEPSEMKQRHAMSWLPFGAGPRSCVAQQLAELQMLLFLTTLLPKYQLTVCADTLSTLPPDNTKFLLMPNEELMLRLELL